MRAHVAAVVLLLGLAPASAHAVDVSLGVGGGYWFENAAQFDFNVRVNQRLGRVVSLGFRPGIALNVRPGVEVGLPLDAAVRFHLPRVYFDLLGGLWVLFGNSLPLRAHIAAGFGVSFGQFSVGVEAGWLQTAAQLLARVSFSF